MANNNSFVKPSSEPKNEKGAFLKKPDKVGKVTETIGTGANAKDSIVYLTIKWAFISGVVISIFIITNNWIFRVNEKVPDFGTDMIRTWDFIVPIITLALGYAFGKAEK